MGQGAKASQVWSESGDESEPGREWVSWRRRPSQGRSKSELGGEQARKEVNQEQERD